MLERSLLVSLMVVSLGVVACGSSKKKDGEDTKSKPDKGTTAGKPAAPDPKPTSDTEPVSDTKAAADTRAAADAKPEPSAQTAEPAVTLVSVSQGDMGCYIEVEDDKGETVAHLGGFDLCPEGEADVSALEGKKVRLTIVKEQIPAGTCEGDPDCTDTEEADVVSAVVAAE